jgi:hypothetical protein
MKIYQFYFQKGKPKIQLHLYFCEKVLNVTNDQAEIKKMCTYKLTKNVRGQQIKAYF